MNRLVQGSSLGRAKHMDVSAAPQMTAGDFTDNSVSPTIVNVFNSSQSDAFFPHLHLSVHSLFFFCCQ